MKEKIERLAKGIFEYELPCMLLSEQELQLTVVAGTTYSGSFTIFNSKNTPVKGVLYSSSELLHLEQSSFTEAENVIQYSFKAEYMNAGETAKGEISVISDCGEIQLPFTVNVEPPYSITTMGKIKDLFQFTNLAKADWLEALKLFQSEEFQRVFLLYEKKYIILYEHLLKSKSISQSMEEFLIAVHKKTRINIGVDRTTLKYEVGEASFQDKLVLTKDNWGYSELRVSSDAPFISLEHKIIWSDNFIGNTFLLDFVLEPKHMRSGYNYGRIFLKTIYQTIIIDVSCHCNKAGEKRNYSSSKIRRYEYKITENYLNFRRNEIPVSKYVTDTNALINNMSALSTSNQDYYQLLRIHLLIISGKENQAKQVLKEYEEKSEEWKRKSVVLYCAYLYLEALLLKDEASIQKALTSINDYYKGEYNNWKLLWLLFYLDKKYDVNKALKRNEMKRQYEEGCRSPILYFEAVTTYIEEPSLLHELNDFDLQVLHWGIKHNYLSHEVALQFTYLAGKCKEFNQLLYHSLTLLYDKYKLKDTLAAICSLLIKGRQRSNKYFRWYSLGVEEQLRITELHEYYVYSLDETADIILPQPILLYFIYNSNLNDRKKAYLYAYIVKHKEENPTMYRTYIKHIEQFVLKQVVAHNVSTNLAILYDEILIQQTITQDLAKELPFIMFRHDIYCNNPNIKGVYVVHKDLKKEVYAPFVSGFGVAQVDIYTDNAEIFLVDIYDNFYLTTVEYTLNKLMRWEDYTKTCYELQVNHPMLLLNLAGKAQNYQKFDEQSVEIRKSTILLPGLREEYFKENMIALIYYYYDNFQGELLESYLLQIDLHGISNTERNKIIELFIIRDLHHKALEAINEFGFEGIATNRLIKLSSRILESVGYQDNKNDNLVQLCFHVFRNGKYNEGILKYLVWHFNGTTSEMFELWKAAVGFELDTIVLEERLLGQMLFAESYLVNSLSVFKEYYKKGCNHKLIKAFLSYYAYKYLVKDRIIQPELFTIMKKEAVYEENDVCMLALLKHFTEQEVLTENENEIIDYNIHKFVDKGIVFPYFKNFLGRITLPPKLNDKIYVEYKTNPLHKVMIHYRLEGKEMEEEFISKEMKDTYLGIHVEEFILFYNERIQYYITEEDEEGQVMLTESVNVQLDQDMLLDEDTKYNHINFMLTAMDMQDEKTLMESISSYLKTNYIISNVFKPL